MASEIEKNWEKLLQEISDLKSKPPLIVAVSKKQPVEKIEKLIELGHFHFGENYLQEAEEKIATLKDKEICWHYIGKIQSKKIRKIVKLFSWIHTVDSLQCAEKISAVSAELGQKPNVFLQVNIANELTKNGFSPSDLRNSLPKIVELKGIRLKGLMIFPPQKEGGEKDWLELGFQLFRDMQILWGPSMKLLSMGTSGDYQEAITSGTNLIRIGQGIFGSREP